MLLYSLSLMAILMLISAVFIATKMEWIRHDLGSHNRHLTLDGLRGLCASSVFIHHSVMAYGFYATGQWKPLAGLSGYEANFMGHLGSVGVMLFFMITGFLFADRMLVKGGIEDWAQFYRKRVKRIAPLYFFVVLVVIGICTVANLKAGRSHVTPGQAMQWLGFGFFPLANIGGYASSWTVVCGVLWTLAIEWKFYFLLPVFSIICLSRTAFLRGVLVISLASVAFGLSGAIDMKAAVISLCFCAGAFSAYMYTTGFSRQFSSWWAALIALVAIAIDVKFLFSSYNYVSFMSVALLFLCVSSGNSLFGILNMRPLKFLGVISYSIYLCHGVVLYLSSDSSSLGLNSYAVIAAALIVPFCVVTYRFVERPFLAQKRVEPSNKALSKSALS